MTQPSPVVVDTTQSPHAHLKPVPLTAVSIDDGFWAPRRYLLRAATLPSQYRLLEETGRLDNFRRVSGRVDKPFQGYFFNDSDVYKWIEAAAWTLATDPEPDLASMVDATIDEIAAAQQPDGYLNTYYAPERAGERWSNLKDMHELYCAGHLFQAAVAHHRATGSDRLLMIARRVADNICAVFGPSEEAEAPLVGRPKRAGTCGHPEIEMGLVELARATGVNEYLAQAQYFLDVRGRGVIGGSAYHQDHRPFREFERMVGHAVRAVYLNGGAADLYAESGEAAILASLARQWQNLTTKQMYVSGGIGSRYQGEAFGDDYELPNARAYTETCAAIGLIMWAWRMLSLEGDARYADVLERALYNGFLAGLSLDGQHYFYVNPLANDPEATLRDGTRGRQPWFNCACCPSNIARLLASLPGYVYSLADDTIWCHLYIAGQAGLSLASASSVRLMQATDYPWDGDVAIRVDGQGEFALRLRIPGWCDAGASVSVNGQAVALPLQPGSYAELRRAWRPGDTVRLRLPMPIRRVQSHPYAQENSGRVALMRGPLLYCVEGVDLPGADLRDLVLPAAAVLDIVPQAKMLGGMVTLRGMGQVAPPDDGWKDHLYRTAGVRTGEQANRTAEIVAIPYYAWANRTPGSMRVWLRVE